jgi:Cdc25 family phosphatase
LIRQDIDEIKDQLKDVPKLYFHCAYSQSRGPKSAQKYFDSIKGNTTFDQEVIVLRGGFETFKAVYGNDESVSEGVKPAK